MMSLLFLSNRILFEFRFSMLMNCINLITKLGCFSFIILDMLLQFM